MLKLSLKEGEYVNIGDNIRVVYAGGSGKNGRLMIDAPREMNISRSNNDPNPEKRKDTYYPEPKISEEAQHEIKKIIWNERQKKAKLQSLIRMFTKKNFVTVRFGVNFIVL